MSPAGYGWNSILPLSPTCGEDRIGLGGIVVGRERGRETEGLRRDDGNMRRRQGERRNALLEGKRRRGECIATPPLLSSPLLSSRSRPSTHIA